MTTTPMTPDREREIRTLDLLELMSDRAAPVISGHLAVLLAEVDRLRTRVADLETFAHGCDGEGCVFPHSSWCERAKQQAEENGGCTCPRGWPDGPHPHASYCWLVSPPRDEVDVLRARVAELEKDSRFLSALEAAGVDSWEGYDEAREAR